MVRRSRKMMTLVGVALGAVVAVAGCSSADSVARRAAAEATVPAWNAAATYKTAGTEVMYNGTKYANGWYAGPGACPVQADCPTLFEAGLWKVASSGSAKPHEFASYDYADLKAKYPKLGKCSEAQYAKSNVQSTVDQRIDGGNLESAAPSGGFGTADREALYREYMLPCKPELSSFKPENVKTVMGVLSEAKWDKFASTTAKGDLSMPKYRDADGTLRPWPADPDFASNAYSSFLSAAARYPYFCGEKGRFATVEESCAHEVAAVLAHAAQETGNGDVLQSFYWLREFGYVNGDSKFDTGCTAPFDCSKEWARYYGRGPKQLTYYYNYAGFSAAYFNGDYQFLLSYPDLVAYDPDLYFQSAVWFSMSGQPPKPSIHDVIVGRYQPTACVLVTDCSGVLYNAETGLKNAFGVSIEIVNGGPECRGRNTTQSENRTAGYGKALELLGASDQATGAAGCGFIASTSPDDAVSIFTNDKLAQRVSTWVDLAGKSCTAQDRGGAAMVSITAAGVLEACRGS